MTSGGQLRDGADCFMEFADDTRGSDSDVPESRLLSVGIDQNFILRQVKYFEVFRATRGQDIF